MEGELWTDVHIYVVWSMRKSLANKTYVYSSLNIFQKTVKFRFLIIRVI